MKKLIPTLLIVFLASATVMTTGCKYEEGPAISFKSKSKRIANTWVHAKVLNADGSEQNIDGYAGQELIISEGGTTEVIFQGNSIGTGTWVFSDDKKQIIITQDNGGNTETYDILKLKSDEFWFKDGDVTKQMAPK